MSYFGIVTAVEPERRGVRVYWQLRSTEVDGEGNPLQMDAHSFGLELPEGRTRPQLVAIIRDRVTAEVKPVVDRANAAEAYHAAHMDAIRNMLVGQRYPVA